MKALTLIQPWAWAICYEGKRIENRTWTAPESLIGQRFAIHAGKKYDAGDALHLMDMLGLNTIPGAWDIVRGAVVAVATLSKCTTDYTLVQHTQYRWTSPGSVFWLLDDVVVLRAPVPCKGAQGLWNLPAYAEGLVRRQLESAA